MLFDFTTLDASLRYKLLSATVTPRPIAWVTTLDDRGVPNAAPFSFFNAFGEDPPVVAFSVLARSKDDPKDTARNVLKRGEFVVNLVSEHTLEQMNITAIDFPAGTDELVQAGLKSAESVKIKTPRIASSPVSFECRLMQIVPLGPLRNVIFGEVLAMHIDDPAVIDPLKGYVDSPALRLMGRAGPNAYVPTTQITRLNAISYAQWVAGDSENKQR